MLAVGLFPHIGLRRRGRCGRVAARLGEAVARGDRDAEDQLVEPAGQRGDLDELRRLAGSGNDDAVAVLVELVGDDDSAE